MKFACDNCQAEFLIADEKVGRRGVKVRCKRCSHVIVVRPTPASLASLETEQHTDFGADPSAMLPEVAEPVPHSTENIPTEMEGEAERDVPARHLLDGAMGFSGDATQVTAAPQATVPMTDVPQGAFALADSPVDDFPFGGEPPMPTSQPRLQDEPAFDADDSAGEADEFDEQLAGAFAQMFDDAADGAAVPDAADDIYGAQQTESSLSLATSDEAFAAALSPALLGMEDDVGIPQPNPIDEPKLWFLAVGDENVGPLSLSELADYYARGEMDGASLVWKEEMADWEHASQVPELDSIFESSFAPGSFADLDQGDEDFQGPPTRLTPWTEQAPAALEAMSPASDTDFSTSPLGDFSPTADDGWQPGAASALASLVEAEMQRADEVPSAISDDAAPMTDAIGAAGVPVPVGAASAGLFTDGPGPSAFAGGSQPPAELPLAPSFAPAPPAMLSAAPYGAPVAAARPIWQYAAMLVALVGVAALVKIAFFGPASESTPSLVQTSRPAAPASAPPSVTPPAPAVVPAAAAVAELSPPNGAAMETAATGPVAAATNAGETTGSTVGAVASAPAAVAPKVAGEPKSSPTKASEAKTRENRRSERSARPARPKPEPKLAAASPPPTEAPKTEEERPARAPKKKSNPDCDPVLDFDCDEPSKGAARTSSSKSAAKKSLSRDDVLMVVKKNLGSVHRCFDKHGGKGPVKMQWRIAKSGRTKGVTVLSDQHQNTPIGSCLQDEIRGWRFPSFSGKPPPPVTIPFKARS